MNDAHLTPQIAELLKAIEPVLAPVHRSGWQWRVVGGAVRDLVLGRPVVDIDIEVVAPALADLEQCYADMVPRGAVGSDRQVIRIRTAAYTVDITVATDADVHTAAAGRDLTINALAILPDGTLVDPHGGLADLRQGVLRHIGTAFADDPLRVLRLMRFAGQLNFRVAPETLAHALTVVDRITQIPIERIWHEWRLFALAPHPWAGLMVLYATGWLRHYPMLAALMGCAQDFVHHPEGDVWIHTLYVCEGAVARRGDLDSEKVLILSLAAICHDLGKPSTSYVENGRIHCPTHAAAGVPFTVDFLRLIGAPDKYVAPVCALVREHMAANDGPASPRFVRRLAHRLAPADMDLWARLVAADSSGRPPLPFKEPGAPFMALAAALGAIQQPVAPLLNGNDVLAMGIAAGPRVKELLRIAYDAQLDGVYETRADALQWMQTHVRADTI
ncbi:MAG: CCA tRNA nucleotidyltransferase [Roseiflexaceae bacterium]